MKPMRIPIPLALCTQRYSIKIDHRHTPQRIGKAGLPATEYVPACHREANIYLRLHQKRLKTSVTPEAENRDKSILGVEPNGTFSHNQSAAKACQRNIPTNTNSRRSFIVLGSTFTFLSFIFTLSVWKWARLDGDFVEISLLKIS